MLPLHRPGNLVNVYENLSRSIPTPSKQSGKDMEMVKMDKNGPGKCIYEGHSINQLQNSVILLVFQI